MTIDAPKINAIIYDTSGNFDFYHKNEDGFYQNVYLEFDENDNIITYEKELDTDKRSKKDILRSDETLVDITEIKKVNVNQFISNQSFIFENKNYKYDSPTLFLLQNLSQQLISFSEIIYVKNESRGFGSFEQSSDNEVKKWRISESQFFNKVIINIAENKQIIVLTDGNWQNEIFIPLKNNKTNTIDGYTFKQKLDAKSNKYNSDVKGLLSNFRYEDFYLVKKDKSNKKYNLVSNFNQKLLSKSFDTIYFNNYYIIGKQKDNYSIYHSNLKPLKIDAIKAAHLYKNGLDVLTNKGAQYYNYKGEKINKFPDVSYLVCGTVEETTYTLLENNKDAIPHQLSISSGYSMDDTFTTNYKLKGLKSSQKITFLDKSIGFMWDGNDGFVGSTYIQPQLLRVEENDKVGIVSFNIENAAPFKEKEDVLAPPNPSMVTNKTIKVKTELPIQFDDVKLDRKDGFIYIYNNNKIGIYPQHKQPIYDSIVPATTNFYKIVKNGKSGWLDIQTFKEYFN